MNVVYILCICIHLYTTLLYVALNGLVEDYASICYMNRLTKDVSNSLISKDSVTGSIFTFNSPELEIFLINKKVINKFISK